MGFLILALLGTLLPTTLFGLDLIQLKSYETVGNHTVTVLLLVTDIKESEIWVRPVVQVDGIDPKAPLSGTLLIGDARQAIDLDKTDQQPLLFRRTGANQLTGVVQNLDDGKLRVVLDGQSEKRHAIGLHLMNRPLTLRDRLPNRIHPFIRDFNFGAEVLAASVAPELPPAACEHKIKASDAEDFPIQ